MKRKPKDPLQALKPAKIPRKSRVPLTRADGTWSECRFWGFLRSGLRKMSQRWKPIYTALHRQRRKSQSDNPRLKWEFCCEQCLKWYPRKEVAVDHIEDCGSLKSFDDVAGFMERLFCEADKLRVLCKDCHTGRHGKGEQNGCE